MCRVNVSSLASDGVQVSHPGHISMFSDLPASGTGRLLSLLPTAPAVLKFTEMLLPDQKSHFWQIRPEMGHPK